MTRAIVHRYVDPLDEVWLTTAERIGLAVRRSGDAYAATDGRGTLTIAGSDALDGDDCLAQMIFHELCHALVEGPEAFERADWGLDNASERDVPREHACLRVQASLGAAYGLRRYLAPTTDFRGFYDRLDDDPLQPRHDPTVVAAVLGLQRADKPPWAPHLRTALEATAAIVASASAFASDGSLARAAAPPPEPHPAGFPPSPVTGRRTCADCAWHYRGGAGRAVDRCRQAGGVRIEPSWPGCERWEEALDCRRCGACCRAGYDSVTVSRRDPVVTRHPQLVVDRGRYVELLRRDDRCAALEGDGIAHRYTCSIYDDRPRCCRDLECGGEHCLTARRRVGLSR